MAISSVHPGFPAAAPPAADGRQIWGPEPSRRCGGRVFNLILNVNSIVLTN